MRTKPLLICLAAVILIATQLAFAAGPTIKVAFKNVPSKVDTSDTVPGSVVITLAGFSKPVDLETFSYLLAADANRSTGTIPQVLVFHNRGNGPFTLSLHQDLGLDASVRSGRYHLRVRATADVGDTQVMGYAQHDIEVADRSGDTTIDLANALFKPETGKVGKTSTFTLYFEVTNRTGKPRDVKVKEQVRITGPVSINYPPNSHTLYQVTDKPSSASHKYDVKFTKPGTYYASYEVTSEGAKPLIGKVLCIVEGTGNNALRWSNAGVSPVSGSAGTPFSITLAYKAENAPLAGLDVKETISISGPDQLSSSKTRSTELLDAGAGSGQWRARLSKPGDYTVKASISAPGYSSPEPKVWHVKVTSASSAGASWTRKEPTFQGRTELVKMTATSFSYKVGDKSGTASWSEPPATLKDGDTITTTVQVGGDSSTPIIAQWSPTLDRTEGYVQASNYVPNVGPSDTRTARFKSNGMDPFTTISISHSNGANSVTWNYEKSAGAAGSGAGKSELTDVTPRQSSSSAPKSAVPNSAGKTSTSQPETTAYTGTAATTAPDAPTATAEPGTSQPDTPQVSAVETPAEPSGPVPAVAGQLTVTLEGGVAVIHEILNKSLAQQFDIAPEDKVVSIDGISTDGMSLEQLQSALAGSTGTQVKLRILRADGATVYVTLKRG